MAYKRYLPSIRREQRGAAMVEFAITFLVYLLLIFAIIDFALVIFDASRLAEGTRTGARYAIVNDPACDVFGTDSGTACPSGPLVCPGGDEILMEVESCEIPATTSACRMVEEMDKFMLRYDGDDAGRYANMSILAGPGKVTIRYNCSDVGDSGLPRTVPTVTISAEDVQHEMLMLGFTVTLPPFATTRVGEDMYSN